MRVNLRYFAAIREVLGEHEVIDVPAGTSTGCPSMVTLIVSVAFDAGVP